MPCSKFLAMELASSTNQYCSESSLFYPLRSPALMAHRQTTQECENTTRRRLGAGKEAYKILRTTKRLSRPPPGKFFRRTDDLSSCLISSLLHHGRVCWERVIKWGKACSISWGMHATFPQRNASNFPSGEFLKVEAKQRTTGGSL